MGEPYTKSNEPEAKEMPMHRSNEPYEKRKIYNDPKRKHWVNRKNK